MAQPPCWLADSPHTLRFTVRPAGLPLPPPPLIACCESQSRAVMSPESSVSAYSTSPQREEDSHSPVLKQTAPLPLLKSSVFSRSSYLSVKHRSNRGASVSEDLSCDAAPHPPTSYISPPSALLSQRYESTHHHTSVNRLLSVTHSVHTPPTLNVSSHLTSM